MNNDEIMSPFVKIMDFDSMNWGGGGEMRIYVNVVIYLITREFLKQLSSFKIPRPTIINTSSINGIEPFIIKSGSSIYCIRKFVVIKFTEFLAEEYPEIRVFVYHPGSVEIDLV